MAVGTSQVGIAYPPGASWPLTFNNRARIDLARAIARYGGGSGDPVRLEMAVEAIDEARREFNSSLWKFNRMTVDITLAADTAEYSLGQTFRAPERAKLLNSGGVEAATVEWFPFEEYIMLYPDRTHKADPPTIYTLRNEHEDGKVIVHPIPSSPVGGTYPKMRVYFFRRIAKLTGDDSKLNVPEEVEQAIQMLATAIHMGQFKASDMPAVAFWFARAQKQRDAVEQEFRAFPDFIQSAKW